MGKSIHCWSQPPPTSRPSLHSLRPQRLLGSSAQFPQSFLRLQTRSRGMHILPSPPQSNSVWGSQPIWGSPNNKKSRLLIEIREKAKYKVDFRSELKPRKESDFHDFSCIVVTGQHSVVHTANTLLRFCWILKLIPLWILRVNLNFLRAFTPWNFSILLKCYF